MRFAELDRPTRVLDFDIENRPLTYLGGDWTTADITAIAWSFGRGVEVRLLGRDEPEQMLADFCEAYNEADVVTGHYIRRHDLPMVNGALLERGLPGLTPKMSSDTKMDLVRVSGVSKSQESLAAMLGIRAPKLYMSQAAWRAANRLEHVELAERRVVLDVKQHMALRKALVARGLLGPGRVWRP